MRTLTSVCLAMVVSLVVYAALYEPETTMTIAGCSLVSTGFLYYVFRNNLTSLKAYVMYAFYGIAAGTAAYLLGSLIVIASGLIGFWLTVGILTLETAFTAVYTYIGLLDWVTNEKRVRTERAAYQARLKAEAEAAASSYNQSP